MFERSSEGASRSAARTPRPRVTEGGGLRRGEAGGLANGRASGSHPAVTNSTEGNGRAKVCDRREHRATLGRKAHPQNFPFRFLAVDQKGLGFGRPPWAGRAANLGKVRRGQVQDNAEAKGNQ
jgi:hypothetical protein